MAYLSITDSLSAKVFRKLPRTSLALHQVKIDLHRDAPIKTGRKQRMKEPYTKGLATHGGPESCALARKGSRSVVTIAPEGCQQPT